MDGHTDALADEQALETRLINEVEETHPPPQQGYSQILQQFVWMGWSAFGGPSAHIGPSLYHPSVPSGNSCSASQDNNATCVFS